MVGSYSSTKWFWISWMVRADFPTPPPPVVNKSSVRPEIAMQRSDSMLFRGVLGGVEGHWQPKTWDQMEVTFFRATYQQ